jgi:outer membrane protein
MKYILILLLFFSSLFLFAQQPWTLQACIDRAKSANLTLRQKQLAVQQAAIAYKSAHYQRLPTLSGSVYESYNMGISPTSSGTYQQSNASVANMSASLSLPLFTGFRIRNGILSAKQDLKASQTDYEQALQEMVIDVMAAYLQVVLDKELTHSAQEQVKLSVKQVDKTERQVQVGKLARSDLYDSRMQIAKDSAALINAETNQQLALVDLEQLLQLEETQHFDISISGLDTVAVLPVDVDVFYQQLLPAYPAVQSAHYRIEKAKADMEVARAGYWPTLDLSAGYYNGYYYYYNLDEGAKNTSFSKQFYQNQQQVVGVTLSIPLFDRFAVKQKVQSAKISLQQQQVALETAKQNLSKTVQKIYYRAVAARGKLLSLQKEEEAAQMAYQSAVEKREVGKSTAFEVNEKQTALSKAQSERIQAKYDYLFACKTLELYKVR